MKPRLLLLLALFTAFCFRAGGVEIFSQDFENDLGPNESVSGNFSINSTNDALNNGTKMMGHADPYASLPSYSYYDLTLDLRGFTDVTMAFDFTGGIEADFDGFNLLASETGEFSPPEGLLDPAPASELEYRGLTIHGASSPELGPDAWSSAFDSEVESVDAAFDLSDFSEKKVTIRFQFGTDAAAWGDGANFDNIVVEGTALPDTDGDGMPDNYEDANGQDKTVNDRDGDLDGDTLTNIQEFERCSDPQKVDTDEDGLADNVETGTGEWVSATDTGTSPSRADTDGDGAPDGVETNTGTFVSETDTGSDPHNVDTDGDSAKDGFELACGSSPVDALDSCSNFRGNGNFTITHIWTNGTPQLNNAADVEAAIEDPVDAEILEVQYPYIHFHDNAAPPASLTFDQESRPYPIWDEENGGDDVGFGDRNDFAILVEGQIWVNVTGTATFVCNSDDGFVLEIDGEEIGQAGNRGRGDTIMTADLTAGPHDFKFIHWERGGGAGVTLAAYRSVGDAPAPNPEDWILLQAYEVPPGEPALIIEDEVLGNQEFGGALGMDFIVNLPIQVFELGAFDSESDGLSLPITVELWSRDDGGTPDDFADDLGGEILASLELEDEEGMLEGGTRFMSLEQPITLQPGAYTIVGWGYGAGEPNYNVGGRDAAAEGLTITESQFITFVGGSRFGDAAVNGEFPASPDAGPENRYGSGNFKFGSTGDTDGDGMDDAWEDLHELDKLDAADATQDPDADGLDNLGEFKAGTLPNVADTDEDGLKDGVETGTGVWVSADDTGTLPKKSDSDSDGLSDGVETKTGTFVDLTNTGTDPNLEDSDGDSFVDNREIDAGTDPTDPLSFPMPPDGDLIAFWDFNDSSVEDKAVDNVSGIEGEVTAVYTEDGDGRSGAGGDRALNFADGGTVEVTELVFMDAVGITDSITVSLWQKNEGTPDSSSFWITADGFDRAAQAHIPWSNNQIYWDTAGGCCAAGSQRLNFDPSAELDEFDFLDESWHHYAFVKNQDVKQVWIDGILAFETEGGDPMPETDYTLLNIGSANAGGNPASALIDDFAIYAVALTEEEIVGLANGDTPGGSSGGPPFQITGIERSADKITLTWPSKEGQEFALEFSENLQADGWIEIDDGLEGTADQTTFGDEDAARLALEKGFYRVRRN